MNGMDGNQAAERAAEYFAQGFNCAEAVLRAVAQARGADPAELGRLATGFGAGIGYWGEICGSLTGAVMALGMQLGRRDAGDVRSKARVYALAEQLLSEFQEEFGNIRCLSLTGCDMRTPEGLQRAKDQDLHHSLCPKFVAFAARRVMEMIEEEKGRA